MSETTLVEIRLKIDDPASLTDGEIELMASVLDELLVLMQQSDEAED